MRNKKHLFSRLAALALAAAMTLSSAQALTVEQARELLEQHYVDPIDPEVLDLPTIPAILDALGDPYTEYLSPREYAGFMASMEDGSAGGIGVSASMTEEGLLIDQVTDGSPAQAAGLRPGDLLVAVDGKSLSGMELDRAVELIRGPEGTSVHVTYARRGRTRSATLTRTAISIPATTGYLLEGGVGYIDCDTWGEETLGHFQDLMAQMEDQADCWLIDLRSNTGGLSDAAADVAGLFCGPGTMLSLRLRAQERDDSEDGYVYELYGSSRPALTDKPAVILVDGYTASASEAFCAAMRDYGRAAIVGGRTYGKGVAQGIWDRDTDPGCFPDGDCLKITIARFYSPIGNTNHVIGVMPDFLTADADTEGVGYALAQRLAQTGEDWPATLDALLAELLSGGPCFPDTAGSVYQLDVDTLALYGLVGGKGDGLFHGGDALTRAELAQLLYNALAGYEWPANAPFADVAPDAWYAQAVAAVTDLGLMEGAGDGLFAPDRVLTCQELVTVLGRTGRWLNDDLDYAARTAGAETLTLRVLADYADWAKPSVWLLSCAMENSQGGLIDLLWDDPEDIVPTAPATRAEAAQVLYSLLYYLDILP